MGPRAPQSDRLRVLVAGGGVAALETILAIRELAGARVELALLAPERQFVLRASSVTEPFERGTARRLALDEFASRHRTTIHQDSLIRVDPVARTVTTAKREEIGFDFLVLAIGARPASTVRGATTFAGPGDSADVKAVLDDLRAGRARSVAFVLPSERTWPLPLYELAVLTASELASDGAAPSVTVVTPEQQPLAVFGPQASAAVRQLLDSRGIRLRTLAHGLSFDDGGLVLAGGERLRVDRAIALPELVGPEISGVPRDQQGFIPVDEYGRVAGLTSVYAAGDATGYPLKQGGLAAQQADAVAAAIAARAGADVDPEPFRPVLRGLLMTGGVPLYLRAELPSPWDPEGAIHTSASEIAPLRAAAAGQRPLWWPPAKVAGRLLGPYLATARPNPLSSHALTDRPGGPDTPVSAAEHDDALALALLLADGDAESGDLRSALRALDAAEALAGTLPAGYEEKRARWLAALSPGRARTRATPSTLG